jgi:hypothetical protein
MSSCISQKKPYLKPIHRKRRREWAEEAKAWERYEWTLIIWTDESSVELGKNTHVCRVWRSPGEVFDERCLAPTFKSGRSSVMIWSCIAYDWKGPLVFIPKDRRTGADYVDLILSGPLWDAYVRLYGERGVAKIMEDGAPIHRSAAAKRFCNAHQMETIPHPAQSPDMNPIENAWKLLKEWVNGRPTIPANVEELKGALLEEWERIDIEFINRLVESMPERVQALRKAKGGPTKW